MNGATTEPCVKIINAPIKTIVIIKVANQYFLRTLRKSQMSLTISKNGSKVLKNTCEVNLVVFSVFSVSFFSFTSNFQWIISKTAHGISDWLQNSNKDQSQNKTTINPPQNMTQYHPTFIRIIKYSWSYNSKNQTWNTYKQQY